MRVNERNVNNSKPDMKSYPLKLALKSRCATLYYQPRDIITSDKAIYTVCDYNPIV